MSWCPYVLVETVTNLGRENNTNNMIVQLVGQAPIHSTNRKNENKKQERPRLGKKALLSASPLAFSALLYLSPHFFICSIVSPP